MGLWSWPFRHTVWQSATVSASAVETLAYQMRESIVLPFREWFERPGPPYFLGRRQGSSFALVRRVRSRGERRYAPAPVFHVEIEPSAGGCRVRLSMRPSLLELVFVPAALAQNAWVAAHGDPYRGLAVMFGLVIVVVVMGFGYGSEFFRVQHAIQQVIPPWA